MIRAIVDRGRILPLDPLPADWSEGRELVVSEAGPEPPDDPEEIDRQFEELRALGAARYEPGEYEAVEALMAEADAQAKAYVRREMGLP